jgi:FMN-dependent oxidoreductase (nitrilotriacetate monooxygenase family)
MDALPPHDERYDRAEEFVEICKALWDSWELDAVVMNRETGHYADHTKVHPIKYVGKFHKVRGPLNMPAGPQRQPVICQAGGSPRGRDFAARHANAIVVTQPLLPKMVEYRADIRARAEKFGRNPDDVKVFFHLAPVIGETGQEAQELHHRLFGMEDPLSVERVLAMTSAVTEIDFGQFDLDAPFPQDLTTNGHQSVLNDLMARNKGKTLRQSLSERAQLGPQVVGTIKSVADQMEAMMAETGGDGFLMLAAPHTRRYIDTICSGLAPELRRRGLIRKDYPHKLFKDNLLDF